MRILVLLAGASVALWGMSTYASYLNSVFLAVLIVLASGPLVDWLRARRLPGWASLLITLLIVGILLVLFGFFLIYATAQFVETLPAYKTQVQAMAQQVQSWLQGMGMDAAGSTAVAGQTDVSWMLDLAANFLGALAGTLGSLTTMAMLMIFLFVDVILFPGRLAWQAQHASSYAGRVNDFTADLRQYIVVMVIIGAAIGTLNTVWFYFIGVPQALLWGVLSGILNFIPFIGFWFGLIPPAILTLLAYGPQQMILMAAGYILVNATVQNVIQPKLVVSRLNLTPFMSLLSATFWPLVLGPVGAIIGVPLTMAVHSLLLEPDPSTRWLAAMMRAKTPEQERQLDGRSGSDDAAS
jgi:AI-2 transport protein TqsA